MIKLMQEITKQFKEVIENSHHYKNTSKKITYPYLTFDLSGEDFENMEGFYIDVDIFDRDRSYTNLFTLESQLKLHFKKKDTMLDDLFIRFNYLRANTIDTQDDLLKRRNLQFYCKVYRRD